MVIVNWGVKKFEIGTRYGVPWSTAKIRAPTEGEKKNLRVSPLLGKPNGRNFD